ncbi:MAG: hydrogenase large subunit [Elusimicrobiota bacterium]
MSPVSRFACVRNGEPIRAADIPVISIGEFRDSLIKAAAAEHRLCAIILFSDVEKPAGLLAVMADDFSGKLYVVASEPTSRYESLTPVLPAAHLFEREIFEQSAIIPEGHPWLKSVRRQRPDETAFFQERGAEIHEVAVGPIHAGIIEPGHFRFQCHGETVHHLEIQLGYQNRGAQRLLGSGPDRKSLAVAESICGDTAIGHSWAGCALREALADCRPSLRAEALRAMSLEIERLANHIGDLGAMSGDVGFLPASAYFGRMRGDFLNLLMLISGNRYGKGLIRPGGAAFDIPLEMQKTIRETIAHSAADLEAVGNLFFSEPSVISRLEGVGTISAQACRDLGLVGPCARAAGADRDVRRDHPIGFFRFRHIPVSRLETGDVYARAMIRRLESRRSLEFLADLSQELPEGQTRNPCGSLRPDSFIFVLIEGWRGEICHAARTGKDGRFAWYKAIDPSFHNWMAVAIAMRGEEISDFPLCNKSFNLSYAGHDL